MGRQTQGHEDNYREHLAGRGHTDKQATAKAKRRRGILILTVVRLGDDCPREDHHTMSPGTE
eukprot:8719834-Alexandrium_andersonii.AAC.1